MSGRHTGEQHSHTVEGTDPQLYVQVHEPQNDAGLRPVLLLHGFSSSSKLNWEDTGWLAALNACIMRVSPTTILSTFGAIVTPIG